MVIVSVTTFPIQFSIRNHMALIVLWEDRSEGFCVFSSVSAAILIHHISFRFISYRFESVRYFHNDVYLQHSDQ